jgi:hypothetical protein
MGCSHQELVNFSSHPTVLSRITRMERKTGKILIFWKNEEEYPLNIQNTGLLFCKPLADYSGIICEIGFSSRNSRLNAEREEVSGG